MNSDIRWQQRVNRPYQLVHDTFLRSSMEIIQWAAISVAKENDSPVKPIVAPKEFGPDLLIKIKSDTDLGKQLPDKTVIDLEWRSDAPSILPATKAKILIVPDGDDAKLDFLVEYSAKPGMVGQAIDAAKGAESSVNKFLTEIAERLHAIIPNNAPRSAFN